MDNDGYTGVRIPENSGIPYSPDVREYVLTASIDGQYLAFLYSSMPAGEKADGKAPLLMRVPTDCTIKLTLDNSLRWRFPPDGVAIRLGPATSSDPRVTPPDQRYANLKPVQIGIDCKSVTFSAVYLPLKDPQDPTRNVENFDLFNIFVVVDQPAANGNGVIPDPLLLMIDPGIKNPGDDTAS